MFQLCAGLGGGALFVDRHCFTEIGSVCKGTDFDCFSDFGISTTARGGGLEQKNLDEQIKVEIMKEYAKTLKRSGYSERFRHEVISDAMRCHQKMLKTAEKNDNEEDGSKT